MKSKFDILYESIMNSINFDFETYDKYGKDNKIVVIREGKPRKAEKMKENGEITTREGIAKYNAGDWILTDEQCSKYPVKADDFEKLYDISSVNNGFYMPKPKERTMFRTNEEMHINTEWGDYTASVGDYVQINSDGSLGCPVKPDAMKSGYKFVREIK